MKPSKPLNSEQRRQEASIRYINFNFNKDEHLKGIAKIASYIMDTPVSLITLIDEDTQWIVSPHGIDLHQMPRQISFAHTPSKMMKLCYLMTPCSTSDLKNHL